MTSDATDPDDWLSNPAPPPTAIEGHPKALQPVKGGKLDELADSLKSAPVAAEPGAKDPGPAPEPKAGDGPKPPRDKSGRPKGEIWDGCPIKALGVNGDFNYFLDRHGQLRMSKELKAQTIAHYFGERMNLLYTKFPQFDKNGDRRLGVFNAQSAAFAMIAAASERGLFNPDGAVRGVGAWTDDEGQLVYHTGQSLIRGGETGDPGEIDGKIYPAYPPIPSPTLTAGRANAAEETLATLSTWNWGRPDIDPMLTLGMAGVQMFGGALTWRPAFWFAGDKASGKSTLQELIKWLHGDKGLIQSNDPTKSGITARLGHSSLPVALDELEPGDEGSSKERDIIVLARVASSGGQWLRGTADQKGASGNVYSTFMFSSILIPGSMGAQDRSRLITLNLFPPDKDAPKPVIDPRTWKARGASLKRILIDRWPTWAERLELWRIALAKHDMAGRNGDNWATTMAMADMALNAELPAEDHLDTWARKIAFGARAEVDDIGSNAEDMLTHLLGQPYDVHRRGKQYTVAQWVLVAGQMVGAPYELVGADTTGSTIDAQMRADYAKRANTELSTAGLRVMMEGDERSLFIPNKPIPGLKRLFQHSQWSNGVWSQAAARIPGARKVPQPLSFSAIGERLRGVYVPFTSIAGLMAFPMDHAPAQAAPPTPEDWEETF